jgi:hypothetical protein
VVDFASFQIPLWFWQSKRQRQRKPIGQWKSLEIWQQISIALQKPQRQWIPKIKIRQSKLARQQVAFAQCQRVETFSQRIQPIRKWLEEVKKWIASKWIG